MDVDVEKYLRNIFIKFSLHIYKWNKELFDFYTLDINLIKAGKPNMFYDKILLLIAKIRENAQYSKYI